MLTDKTLFGNVDKVAIAIERIRQFEPSEGYYVAFSGGKDSCVLLDLVKRSGVKYDAHYNLTTVDPPELVYFIREHHSEVIVHKPRFTMWQLIEKNMVPPTRLMRYCCRELKENDKSAKGHVVVTGVRWEESTRRASRQMVELCRTDTSKRFLHPIIDWTEQDIWQYIHENKLPYCKLYDEGKKRIGCVLCPQQGTIGMLADAERWPKIANAYKMACVKAFQNRKAKGNKNTKCTSGEQMYEWWISGKAPEKSDPNQEIFHFD